MQSPVPGPTAIRPRSIGQSPSFPELRLSVIVSFVAPVTPGALEVPLAKSLVGLAIATNRFSSVASANAVLRLTFIPCLNSFAESSSWSTCTSPKSGWN